MTTVTSQGADTLIIFGRDQATLYEFLKPRQEAAVPRTIVLLDRRAGERRQDGAGVSPDRRQQNRRAPTPEAALALMSVLGFMILHRDGDRWTS
jgi:hypothetical protein